MDALNPRVRRKREPYDGYGIVLVAAAQPRGWFPGRIFERRDTKCKSIRGNVTFELKIKWDLAKRQLNNKYRNYDINDSRY